jgi:hypothetical protein
MKKPFNFLLMVLFLVGCLSLSTSVRADGLGFYQNTGDEWFLSIFVPGAVTNYNPTFGLSVGGELAVAGDWDGDGIDGLAVFDKNTNLWSLTNDATVANPVQDANGIFGYGPTYDYYVLSGDWDGDGDDSLAFHIPVAGTFYYQSDVSSFPGNTLRTSLLPVLALDPQAKRLQATGMAMAMMKSYSTTTVFGILPWMQRLLSLVMSTLWPGVKVVSMRYLSPVTGMAMAQMALVSLTRAPTHGICQTPLTQVPLQI